MILEYPSAGGGMPVPVFKAAVAAGNRASQDHQHSLFRGNSLHISDGFKKHTKGTTATLCVHL